MPTEVLCFDRPPGLPRLYAAALLNARHTGSTLLDVAAELSGVVVEPGSVADYARVCGYTLGSHPPVSWPHLLGFPLQMAVMSRADFPLPMVGLVHITNRMMWARPLDYGESVDVRVHADALRPHRRGRVVDLVAEVSTTDGGAVVWRGVSTYLARGRGDAVTADDPVPDVSDLRHTPGAGMWRVEEDAGRRYAAVSGDVNPIHLHALSARLLGFDRAIAHGMFTYAHSLAALGARLPAAGLSSVWFRQPVRLPSTVRLLVAADGTRAVLYPDNRPGEHLVLTVTPA